MEQVEQTEVSILEQDQTQSLSTILNDSEQKLIVIKNPEQAKSKVEELAHKYKDWRILPRVRVLEKRFETQGSEFKRSASTIQTY